MPGIFISYRRSDNPDAVGRLYDRLVSGFGKSAVFKDVDSIPLGQDFHNEASRLVMALQLILDPDTPPDAQATDAGRSGVRWQISTSRRRSR